jgi:hypothetical protein
MSKNNKQKNRNRKRKDRNSKRKTNSNQRSNNRSLLDLVYLRLIYYYSWCSEHLNDVQAYTESPGYRLLIGLFTVFFFI